MPDVQIAHVIFTRVEKNYSSRGYSGYQIVYQSPSLGDEIAQIEKLVQCFSVNKQEMNRYQFFWTANKQAVFTKSISLLAPDKDVIDRNQRDAFLVHALVVSQEHFALVNNDPFAMFEAAENMHLLTENVGQLVAYLRTAPPPELIQVPVRTQIAPLEQEWSKDEIQIFYEIGEAAPLLSEQKKSILMIAAHPDAIFQLLSSLLILLPPSERAACTFDTFVDNCMPSAGSFWTLGNIRSINNSSLVPMYLAEHKLPALKKSGGGSAYALWFSSVLQNVESFEQLREDLAVGQIVAEAFKAQRALPGEPLKEEMLQSFYRVNQQEIDARFYAALTTVVEKRIVEAIFPSLHAHISLTDRLNTAASGTCSGRELAKIIYRWLINEQSEWKGWEDILKFALQVQYVPLALLASIKARSPWPFMSHEKLLSQAVQALLEAGTLPDVLEDFFGDEHDDSSRRLQLKDEEFQMVVNALLQQNAGKLLQPSCVKRVASLQSRKVVLALAKAAIASNNVAPEFLQALQDHTLYTR